MSTLHCQLLFKCASCISVFGSGIDMKSRQKQFRKRSFPINFFELQQTTWRYFKWSIPVFKWWFTHNCNKQMWLRWPLLSSYTSRPLTLLWPIGYGYIDMSDMIVPKSECYLRSNEIASREWPFTTVVGWYWCSEIHNCYVYILFEWNINFSDMQSAADQTNTWDI